MCVCLCHYVYILSTCRWKRQSPFHPPEVKYSTGDQDPPHLGGYLVAPERSVYFTYILLCCIWKGTMVNSNYMHLEVNNIHREHYCLQENVYFWFRIKYNMSLTNWNLCVSNSHTLQLCEIIIWVVIFHSYLKSNWPSHLITEFVLYFLKWCLFKIPSC